MIYLARPVNDRLAPLKKGRFPWDLSSIRISRKKLEGISPAIGEKYHGQLEALVESEKRLNKYSLILPVMQTAEGKWASEGVDGNGDQVDVLYDESMGLMVGEEKGATKIATPFLSPLLWGTKKIITLLRFILTVL